MKEKVLCMIILKLIVFTNAKWTNDDDDLNLNSLEESLIRRYLSDKYLSFKHQEGPASTESPTFTEAQRKFQNESLEIHNILRARHCVPPLILDDEINIRAQAYAQYLASNDSKLIHSSDRHGLLGENLCTITRTNPITYPDGDKVTRAWYSEIAFYDYNKPGYKKNIAHFSQVVWKNTKRLGVGYAFAREGRKMYAVAQYGPPGNYGFAYSTNVLERTC